MTHLTLALFFAILPVVAGAAPSNVSASRVGTQVIGRSEVCSSTQLVIRWTPTAADGAHHFEVVATEGTQGTSVMGRAEATASSLTLTDLKSYTTYSVVVKACRNEACSDASAATAVAGSTDAEYWQLRGTGNRDGKVVTFQQYTDTAQWTQLMG